jgi:hypothetical protein
VLAMAKKAKRGKAKGQKAGGLDFNFGANRKARKSTGPRTWKGRQYGS